MFYEYIFIGGEPRPLIKIKSLAHHFIPITITLFFSTCAVAQQKNDSNQRKENRGSNLNRLWKSEKRRRKQVQ